MYQINLSPVGLTEGHNPVECALSERVVSSAGRASPLQGEGHWFDPSTTHQFIVGRLSDIARRWLKAQFYSKSIEMAW